MALLFSSLLQHFSFPGTAAAGAFQGLPGFCGLPARPFGGLRYPASTPIAVVCAFGERRSFLFAGRK